MHRVTWSMGPQSLAVLYPNGAHVLPEPIVAATRAYAIVLVDNFAYLAFDDGLRDIPPDQPFVGAGWSLTWMREPTLRPSALMGERTRSDEAIPSSAVVTIFDPEGREHQVDRRPILVGRHPACDIPTVDRRVSLFHCALLRSGQAIRVVDLGSRNGTYVDGTRVGEATVARHAALRVGRKRLEVRAVLPDRGPAPARSSAMRLVESQVARIAPSSATVMIEGESGAGKELVARQLHQLSGRGGAFVAINAAVLSSTLASSELFGHVRGAFTGAETDRLGAFAAADGGTLFLDEVAELSPSVQAELLRAVELRLIRRLGENVERPVDVRLVVASHRNLAEMVRADRFREDLFHRLSVITLKVPPLRERHEDLVEITERFMRSQQPPRSLTPAAWEKLRLHGWPGNVRELINTLTRACVMSDASELTAADLLLAPRAAVSSIDHLITDAVMSMYSASGQNTARTARELGIARRTVHRLVRASQARRKA